MQNKTQMQLWFIERGQLIFLKKSDGPEHLTWCLSFLVSSFPGLEQLRADGKLVIRELGSTSECLDLETLSHEGSASGLQRVFAVIEDGRRFEQTRDINYY